MDLAAAGELLLDALDRALPGRELDRGRVHPERCPAIVEEGGRAFLTAVDGARADAGAAAGAEDAAGLHQRASTTGGPTNAQANKPLTGDP